MVVQLQRVTLSLSLCNGTHFLLSGLFGFCTAYKRCEKCQGGVRFAAKAEFAMFKFDTKGAKNGHLMLNQRQM